MTTHKKNSAKPLTASLKRTIALKAIGREDTVSQISKDYACSRTTVYNQHRKALQAANHAFDEEDGSVLYCVPVTKSFIHQAILGLGMICKSSYRDIKSFLKTAFDYSVSIGTVFNVMDDASNKAKAINQSYDLSLIKTSAADELFHRNKPILDAVDIDSRFCALLAKADKRDYETWGIHLLDLQSQGYSPEATLMDSAKGLIKGHAEVLPSTVRRLDHFHLIKDLKDCGRFLKYQEDSAITKAFHLQRKANNAKNEARKKYYSDAALAAFNEVGTLEDNRRKFNLLAQWLQHDVLQLPGHEPHTRAVLYDFILREMTALSDKQPHRISDIVTSLYTQRDALLDVANTLNEQFTRLAEKHKQPVARLWDLCFVARYDINSFKYNEKAEALETLMGSDYDKIEDEVLGLLENTHRCSSMVENLNSRVRPYLAEQKEVTQKQLALIQFYLNHKPFARSKHARLMNKTPAQALTGKGHPHWLEMLGFSLFRQQVA